MRHSVNWRLANNNHGRGFQCRDPIAHYRLECIIPRRLRRELLSRAIKILNEQAIPSAVYMDHVFISDKNINFYYQD